MAVGSISSLGVGSGLELQNILDSLKEVDKASISRKEGEKEELESRLEAFDSIMSKLFGIKTHALDLSLGSNFLNRKSNVSDSDVLSATVASGTKTGTHTLQVNRLARQSSWQSGGMAAEDSVVTAMEGTFSYTLGNGDAVTLTVAAGTTLTGLASLINEDEDNPGMTATVIDTGVGDTPYRLVLTADESGEDHRIGIQSQIAGLSLTEVQGAGYSLAGDNAVKAFTITDNNKWIDFQVDGGGELGASIATGNYTADELAAAAETALETAAGGTDFTVSYDSDTEQFSISAAAVTSLDLLWQTGTHGAAGTGTSAQSALGFAAADNVSATTYTADNARTAFITIDSTTHNNHQIVFKEQAAGGSLSGNLTASIAEANYTSLGNLAAAIEIAMESASENNTDYAVSYDAGQQKFVIEESGTLESLQIAWTGSSAAATLGFTADDTLSPASASLNAEVEVNGITYQRQSNSGINDVISGVTLNLTQAGTSTVSITADFEAVKEDIVGLVDSVNELIDEIDANSQFDITTGEKGALAMVTSITGLGDELVDLLSTPIATGGEVASLFDLGFSIDREGKLALDETVLAEKFTSVSEEIATFFAGDDDQKITGLGELLNDRLRELTSTTGLVTSEKTATQESIDRLDEQIEMDTERLDRRYETLTAQFVALDVYMKRMQTQADYLSDFFDSMNVAQSKNK